jgi:hypothetical protein
MKIINHKNLIIGEKNNIHITKKPKKPWIWILFPVMGTIGGVIYYWSHIIGWILKFWIIFIQNH